MPFLILSKVEVNFAERKLTWKTYTAEEALFTTKRVQIINSKEFAKAALDLEQEAFIVYLAALSAEPMTVHPDRKAQIAALIAEKAPVTIPVKYADFVNVFSKEYAAMLPEYTKINTHAINLEEGKQSLYNSIYNLRPVELEP